MINGVLKACAWHSSLSKKRWEIGRKTRVEKLKQPVIKSERRKSTLAGREKPGHKYSTVDKVVSRVKYAQKPPSKVDSPIWDGAGGRREGSNKRNDQTKVWRVSTVIE